MFRLSSFLCACALLATTSPASVQCPAWDPGFSYQVGLNDVVRATAVFDDGSGPALYAAGTFTSAGATTLDGIAKWIGTGWAPVGGGFGSAGQAFALAVFDDGGGPALYAGGSFSTAGGASARGIARWNGVHWSPLGNGVQDGTGNPRTVYALLVFDDGSGPALYAGGSFVIAGTMTVNGIAKWNGSNWSALDGGMRGQSSVSVLALAKYDDGGGPALFAGGYFLIAGSALCYSIAKWDGATWSQLGNGTNGVTDSLAVYDDGSGPALYASGIFTTAGGAPASDIAKWNGTSWTALTPVTGPVANTLFAFDDGSGSKLYAGGSFTSIGGVTVNHLARWNGAAWSPLSTGVNDNVWSMNVFDDGSGPKLIAAGAATSAGGFIVDRVVEWNGSSLAPLGASATTGGINATVRALAVVDSGSGPALYAGGDFQSAGTTSAIGIARRNGTHWEALGSGLTQVRSIAGFDDGTGPALYAGNNSGLYRWNGASWLLTGGSMDGPPLALATFDAGGHALYAGGSFHTAGGHLVNAIARWNGSQWSSLANGIDGSVLALEVFDDGSGSALYAGGAIASASGISVSNIARWNGASWSTFGGGMNGHVYALHVFDDGAGQALCAGGAFTSAGEVAASRVAKWNGSTWSPLGAGFDGIVTTLAVHDDGSGPALYAGGYFTHSGAASVSHLARWNGSTWMEVGGGVSGTAFASTSVHIGSSVDGLWTGGDFTRAGDVPSWKVARWESCGAIGNTLCFGDGTSAPCPCSNSGAAGHGCENSASTGGALLAASGTTSPDTVVLHASGELANALSVFLQGDGVSASEVLFGDGLRCASGTLVRLYVENASGGAVDAPAAGEPSITTRSAALGVPIAPGDRRYYQVYYRDPIASFCPPPLGDAFNVTQAVKIIW